MPEAQWIRPGEAAKILGVSRSTVSRSIRDPSTADSEWGPDGWRLKPLTRRREVQLLRQRVDEIAAGSLRSDIDPDSQRS